MSKRQRLLTAVDGNSYFIDGVLMAASGGTGAWGLFARVRHGNCENQRFRDNMGFGLGLSGHLLPDQCEWYVMMTGAVCGGASVREDPLLRGG